MITKEQENIVLENLEELLNTDSNTKPELKIQELGFDEYDTAEIMDSITSAVARFHFYKAGMKPRQFSGAYDNDRIFNKSLEILIGPKPSWKERIREWFKFK